MADGPARGAFFSSQRFIGDEPVKFDKQGCTQAVTPILTSQATGVAIWTLLYYRHVTGEKDPELDRVIDEGVQWLLKTQTPDGGWPYGHTVDGQVSPGAPSGGKCLEYLGALAIGEGDGRS